MLSWIFPLNLFWDTRGKRFSISFEWSSKDFGDIKVESGPFRSAYSRLTTEPKLIALTPREADGRSQKISPFSPPILNYN